LSRTEDLVLLTNTASGYYSVILGGSNNTSSGEYSFIGGGCGNTTSQFQGTAILGGVNNKTDNFCQVMIVGNNITANNSNTTFVNQLSIMSIPTSSVGLPTGAVYSDSCVLKIV
jgi:hypothetical protein